MQSSSSAASAASFSAAAPDRHPASGCFRGSTRPYNIRRCDPLAAGELGRTLKLAPALAQILMHRGYADEPSAREFLSCKLAGLTQPDAMLDRGLAADRLVSAIRNRERIAVFGDYDVDGTTSAVILGGILEQLGGQVSVAVGNRWQGGYGLSDAALERVLASRPSLLVTCDCGSSDHERIAEAQRRGVDVIVVDHHLVPEQPLPALAFLNPHRAECGFSYKGLASAGLVLSLGAAVRAALRSNIDLRDWLDLVALGTIADVAPLDGDNRRLVRAGLLRLAAEDVRPGIAALRELAKLRRFTGGAPLSAVDVAFRMTPRLNAAGRMADPELTLALLRARDIYEARQAAARIEQCNNDRKATEKRVTELAIAQVLEIYGAAPGCGVVVAGDDFHRGVVGITAARIVDRFGVPAIVIGFEGDSGHGSARAPGGFPLYGAIARCSESLSRFGGHDAAAGLSIERANLERFRADFSAASDVVQSGQPPHVIDVTLAADHFSLPSANDLTLLEPLGAANAEPVFLVEDARVIEVGSVGGSGEHLKLELRIGNRAFRAFGYDMGRTSTAPLQVGNDVRAIGNLRPDTWMGGDRVELRLIEVEAH